jgi:2-phospho-L-lactate guanylyltransferase
MHVIVPYTDISPKTRLDPILTASERTAFAQAMLHDVISTLQSNGHTIELLVPTETLVQAREQRDGDGDDLTQTETTAVNTEAVSTSTSTHNDTTERDTASGRRVSHPSADVASVARETVMTILGDSNDLKQKVITQSEHTDTTNNDHNHNQNQQIDTVQSHIQPSQITVTADDRALTPAINRCLDRLSNTEAPFSELAVVMADLALITPAAIERLFAREGDIVLAPGRGGGTNAIVVRHPAFTVDYHGTSYRDHYQTATDASLSVGVVDSMRLGTDIDEPADLPEVLFHNNRTSSAWLQSVGIELSLNNDTGRVGVTRKGSCAYDD